MTETLRPPAKTPTEPPSRRGTVMRAATAVACAVLGFTLVAQVRATEDLGERLEIEREEDLARILADLSTQSDRLQAEITDLRLTLLSYENSAESEDLALRALRNRLNELRILAGTVGVEGQGVRMTIVDPGNEVTQAELVDTVQELRDAGAEAISVSGVRLVASSSFVTRNGQLVLDGRPLVSPHRIVAVGPSETIAKALGIPGGAVDALQALPQVTATVEALNHVTVPARAEPVPFVFGQPVPPDEAG
jgi:uncharacterized protein YlxW (UPF0749 family)